MMNMIYALTVNGRPFIENAKEAGNVTLLGMCAIFAVLSLLWLAIEVLHRILVKPDKKAVKAKKEAEKASASIASSAASAASQNAPAAEADQGAIVAAITAAISAAMAEEGYTGGFRVVSFKRASDRKGGRR